MHQLTGSLLAIALAFLGPALSAQQFPAVNGETADGRTISLPHASVMDWTIIGVASSQKAGPKLEEWFEPAYLRFIAQHGLMAGAYEADVYFIPLFVGLNKAAFEPSMKKFRKSADPEIVDHVLFVKDGAEELVAQLGMTEKDEPYFFLLDRDGRIVHRLQGTFTELKLEALEDQLLE